MSMFCYKCQETLGNKNCNTMGVCGKSEETAKIQDYIIYTLKGIGEIVVKGKIEVDKISDINHEVLRGLFMTITNANFDNQALYRELDKLIELRNDLKSQVKINDLSQAATFSIEGKEELMANGEAIGSLGIEDVNKRSLSDLIIFGLTGMAAYCEHALNNGYEDLSIYSFIYEALCGANNMELTVEELIALSIKTGEFGVKAMALLDKSNTEKYGNPEITKVNIGVGDKPGILVSGHDLKDLEQLLEQTKDKGIDIYTHGEMLPANYYPAFKKYDHLIGNYGNAWWQQLHEFKSFNGPVLFTTNCIVPTRDQEVVKRIFTTGSAGYPGSKHIVEDINGNKDFSEIIELALTLNKPKEIEKGEIVGGFAHAQVLALKDKILDNIQNGSIKKFVVMAGCDGRMKSREYYTDFASKLPEDTIILTAGCAKFRYNKLDLGDINGIPRVLDAGQCNDSYSLAMIALNLKETLGLEDINQLPIAYNIAWYEQKAVIVLLALLYLGVKNIHLGPTLPAFISPDVADFLTKNFQLSGITNVEADLEELLA